MLQFLMENDKIKSTGYFTGTVIIENSKAIEIKASQDMNISNIDIRTDQIVPENRILFNLDFSNSMTAMDEAKEALNDKLFKANNDLNKMKKALEKIINKTIDNVDSINPNDGVTIYAASDGRIKNLTIEEGKKIDNRLISNIIDDKRLKISFKMTPNEYSNMSVGQKIKVSFTGYEGYYDAEVISINPNSVPDKDKVSFVYNGVIEAQNPGLISPGVSVGISLQKDGQVTSTLINAGLVDSYAEQIPVTTEIYSSYDMDVYVTKLNVIEGSEVKKGQVIAVLGGEDLANKITSDIKNIKSMMKQISEIKEEMSEIYSDVIEITGESNFSMDSSGTCTVADKIYVDYVTEKETIRKGETIMVYRIYDSEAFVIKAVVDPETYARVSKAKDKVYYGKESSKIETKAILTAFKEYSKRYELFFMFSPEDKTVTLNDNVYFSYSYEEQYPNVVPVSTIVPIGKLQVGAQGYVYLINEEDSILGKIDVLEEKRVKIIALGDDKAAIEFDKNTYLGMGEKRVVNYIDSTLKNGMRVRTKWKSF